jgi:hypothetical protein
MTRYLMFGAIVSLIGFAGCNRPAAETSPVASGNAPHISAVSYLMKEEPEECIGVMEARTDAKDGDEITLVARVGGRKNPWVEGRAAFMVIDASMAVVATGTESGKGQICLDDCCAALRGECTTMVKFLDDQGGVLPTDARELFQLKPDDMVVIQGHVQRDEEQSTFAVVAKSIYVRR